MIKTTNHIRSFIKFVPCWKFCVDVCGGEAIWSKGGVFNIMFGFIILYQ